MILHWKRDRQSADRADLKLWPLVTLRVKLLVLELGRALLAGFLVLLAVALLAVHAAVLDEAAGRAVLELDGVIAFLAAVGADFCGRVDGDTAHLDEGASLGDRGTEWGSGDTVRV